MNQRYFIPLLIAGTILFLIFVFFIIGYILIYTRKQHRNKLEKARMLHEYEKTVLSARLEEQERSMTQISKEIHDNIAQQIDFIHMNVKAMQEVESPEEYSRFIRNSNMMLQQVTKDLRNISYSLNSDYIQGIGLTEALSKDLEYLKDKKYDCNIRIVGAYVPMTGQQELLLYRIAQEALHNTVKYAQATKIDIILNYSNGCFSMRISDNGIGFESTRQDKMAGLGFENMKQRASLLNAKLDIISYQGKGCSITLSLDNHKELL